MDEDSSDRQLEAKDVVALAKYLLGEYADLHGLDTEQLRREVTLRDFYEFVEEWRETHDAHELADKCGLPLSQVHFCLDEVFGDPFNLTEVMRHLWPSVVNFGPLCPHKPVLIATQITIVFADEVASIVSAVSSEPAILANGGHVNTLLSMQSDVLRSEISDLGLSGMYARGQRVEGICQHLVSKNVS